MQRTRKVADIAVALEHNPITLVHFMAFPGPGATRSVMRGEAPARYLLSTVQQVLDDPFFGGIEVTRVKDPAVRRELAARMKGSGKLVVFSAQPVQLINEERWVPPTDISTPEEVGRRRAVERLLRCVDEAYELGATSMGVISGQDPTAGAGTAEERQRIYRAAMEALCRSLGQVCAYAKERAAALGVEPLTIVLETFDRQAGQGFRNQFMGPSSEALIVARVVRDNIGHKNFGLLYDLSHMPLILDGRGKYGQPEPETPETVKTLAEYLRHVHVGSAVTRPDDPRYGDSHPRFDYPGGAIGEEQLAAFLTSLVEMDFRGPIGIEVMPHGSELSEAVVTSSKAIFDIARNRTDVNYAPGSFYFHTRSYFPESLFGLVNDHRVRRSSLIREAAKARRRPAALTPEDGKLLIVAADHPARRVTAAPGDPVGMGDRLEYLGRLLRVLASRRVDGVMATPDVIDDLFLVDGLLKEAGHEGLLDGRVLIGSMNRSGLAGVEFEMEDRITAYTAQAMAEMGLDAAKLLVRIDPGHHSRYSIQTMSYAAQAANECTRLGLSVFIEVLPVERVEGRYRVVTEPEEMIRAVGVGSAIGASSAQAWLKIPYTRDYDRVVRATTLPVLMLGGESTGNPIETLENFERGMAEGPNVRGAMVGRNVLFPGSDDPYAVADAVGTIVHEGASANQAVRHLRGLRGQRMDELVERLAVGLGLALGRGDRPMA